VWTAAHGLTAAFRSVRSYRVLTSRAESLTFRSPIREDWLEVATLVGLIAALVPTVIALVEATERRDWASAGGWSAFLVLLMGGGLLATLRKRHEAPPETVHFQPFVDIDDLRPWPRTADVALLRDALRKHPERVPFVIGPSGAGKTVLLRRLVPEGLDDYEFRHIDSYTDIEERVEEAISYAGSHADKNVVLVLDQFEQFVAAVLQETKPTVRREREAWILSVLRQPRAAQNLNFVVSVRKEWYYDLAWLGDLVPSPSECFDVSPPEDAATDTRRAIVHRFGRVVGDAYAPEDIVEHLASGGELRPLEIQLVGAVIERAKKASVDNEVDRGFVENTISDVAAAIAAYFDQILNAAPDRRLAMKVLCALSAQTRFRRQRKKSDIIDVMFEDSERVAAAIEYLKNQRLLVYSEQSGYELAHDYLAELFHQQSGSELDPTERDNILFHIDSKRQDETGVIATREARDEARRWSFASIVGVPLVLWMIVRLLQFGIPWVVVKRGPQTEPLLGGAILDLTYFPIFMAHVSWAVYVCLFYHRVCRHIRSGRLRAMGRFMVVNMALCVVAAIFVPYIWVDSIAWGGFGVGLTLLAISRQKALSPLARVRTQTTAWITMVNTLFLGLVGGLAIGLSVQYVNTQRATHYWILASLFGAVALTYACYTMMTIHTLRAAVAKLLGLLARSRGALVPRTQY
jgi:hypothetical protein